MQSEIKLIYEICFPISGKLAVIFRTKDKNARMLAGDKPVGNIINLSDKSVLIYNTLQLAYADNSF